ncbi:MAG TPA: exodeoxyribonuclease III [Planctomycetota bacterium]|nr:exodeoxyribonuclease III [Planctomycetota bacterium]
MPRSTIKIYSWNVNGLRALSTKGILPWEILPRADVICLQETKAHDDQLAPEVCAPKGWRSFWHAGERRGYAGTAIYTRLAPDEVICGIGCHDFDREGRVVGLRFGDLVVLSAYFPNSQEGGARLDYKLAFCDAILAFQQKLLREGYQVALLGDYNIAHRPIDLARPKQNERNPGYLPEERAWMSKFLDSGFRDIYRERNPELAGAYTWWTLRTGARARNIGWRIDYGCVSDSLASRIVGAEIHPDVLGSDHCPVRLDVELG